MESLIVKAALQVLTYHGVPCCLVGELALNYYNVPRVLHVRHLPPRSLASRPIARVLT